MKKILAGALIASSLFFPGYQSNAGNGLKDYSGIINGLPTELKYDKSTNTNILKINISDNGYTAVGEYIDKDADLSVDEVKLNIHITDKFMMTGGENGAPAIYINKNALATDYVDVVLYTNNKELIERTHQKTFDKFLEEIKKRQQ